MRPLSQSDKVAITEGGAPHLLPDQYHPDKLESVAIPAKKGEGIFFSYQAIHCSECNRTDRWRKSVRPSRFLPAFDSLTMSDQNSKFHTPAAQGPLLAVRVLEFGQIAAALLEARRSGHGAFIDCSMLGSLIGVAALQTSEYFGTGQTPRPLGSAHPRNAPYRFPVSMSNYDFNVYRQPPMLGAHTEEVFEEWLSSSADEPTTTDRRRRSQ